MQVDETRFIESALKLLGEVPADGVVDADYVVQKRLQPVARWPLLRRRPAGLPRNAQ